MMDAFSLLQQEHRHATSLMSRIMAHIGNADSSPLQAFQELEIALDLHARVEELHVYPVFQQSEITRDSAAKALEAHRKIKVLLQELSGMPRVDYRWVQKFSELYEVVGRHMQMEEEELFGQAGAVLTRQEAEELGTQVQTAKKEVTGTTPAPAGGIPG